MYHLKRVVKKSNVLTDEWLLSKNLAYIPVGSIIGSIGQSLLLGC